MKEFELFMEGKIRLPKKSVLITIDDGYMSKLGIKILNENKINATLFLITSAYGPQWYTSEYVELHSHTHNLHKTGQCPGGQGGGLKCLSKEKIIEDLKKSSELLNNTTVLCYPFYEYNDHTIETMKEAGYTMGFAGSGAGGSYKARVGGNKYKIPRYTMNKNSAVNDLKKIIG
jgi:peptidoglycan/xylan/chitin deacetylase (PgdA/CDA1 family)